LYTFTSIINLPTPCLSVCLSVSWYICFLAIYVFWGLCLIDQHCQ
jgi:hypothetical protein